MVMFRYARRKEAQFYLAKPLKKELDILLHLTKHRNSDLVIVIDGEEGSGKSTLARQIGAYCSKYLGTPFEVDNIHFDLNQYVDTSIDKGKNWINLLDESRKILNKKRSMGKESVRFTNYLSECRAMNQVHILLVPNYHDLDSYIVNARLKFSIQVLQNYEKSNETDSGWDIKRGNYVMHDKHSLRKYYNTSDLRYKHPKFSRTDMCQFTAHETIDMKKYDAKKYDFTVKKYHTDSLQEESLSKTELRAAKQRNDLIWFVYNNMEIKQKDLAKVIGMSRGMMSDVLGKYSVDLKPTSVLENTKENNR